MPCGQALRALAAACREQMEELTARVIANVAYGFASAAFWDGPLMDAFGDRVAALAHTCTTQVGRRVLFLPLESTPFYCETSNAPHISGVTVLSSCRLYAIS